MIEIRLAEAAGVMTAASSRRHLRRTFPDPPPAAAGTGNRSWARRAADRRARPHRRAVRGLSARSAVRLPGDHPELGTIKAEQPPIVIITSNRTREIHDALKRRCFYHWVDYPDAAARVGDHQGQGAGRQRTTVAPDRGFVQELRKRDLSSCRAWPNPSTGRGRYRSSTRWTSSPSHQRHAGHAAEIPGRHPSACRARKRPRSCAR